MHREHESRWETAAAGSDKPVRTRVRSVKIPMRHIVFAAVVFALLSFAGCGGGDDASDTTAGATGGGGGQTIDVNASDFMFAPADLTAEAGELTINLVNDGQSDHAIEIEGNGVEEESDTISPGDSTSFSVTLEDGTYEIYCPVDGHKDMGMVGTLTVGAGGGGAGGTVTDDSGSTGEDTGSGTGSDDDTNY
jgi:plastocyanin